MYELFVRPDGNPMQFHLANLDANTKNNYVLQIEDHGGKVEETANMNVLTFTIPARSYDYNFVFDVKFIDDCIKKGEILEINLYFLGDERHNKPCVMCKFTMGSSECLCAKTICQFVQNEKSSVHESFKYSADKADKQKKKGSASVSKKNTTKEQKNGKKSQLQQKTLKPTLNIPNAQNETNIISETDSEIETTEIPSFSILKVNLHSRKKKIRGSKSLEKIAHREISELPDPCTSKDKTYDLIVLSSENREDCNDEPQNPIKTDNKSKKKKAKVKPEENKSSDSETEDYSEDEWEISNKLKKFVEETIKGKKLDENGNPQTFLKNFEPWETQAMIKFLLISDSVHEAKGIAPWKEAFKLRFLPRKRSTTVMQNHFKRVILPNIGDYNLKKQELAKFLELGPPTKVLEND